MREIVHIQVRLVEYTALVSSVIDRDVAILIYGLGRNLS